MQKLKLLSFIEKIKFMLGEKESIRDIDFNEINIKHFGDFLNVSDEIFIENMYVLLLERCADEEGKKSKILELKSGKSRKDIINDMQNSEEGKNYINNYTFLGIRKRKTSIDKSLLHQTQYDEFTFVQIIDFYNYRFNSIQFSSYLLDLLNYSGSEFVYLLYKVILQREPDMIGFNTHIENSYLFNDKIYKIYEFIKSLEFQEKNLIYYDLSDNVVLELNSYKDVNYISPMQSSYDNLKYFFHIKYSSVVIFENLFTDNILKDVIMISELTIEPLKTFEKMNDAIFNKNQTIIEFIYDDGFLELLRNDILILDYFNKPLEKGFNLITDYMKNMNYYISMRNNDMILYINNFNNNLNFEYLSLEITETIKYLKKLVTKKDIENLYDIDKNLLEKFHLLSTIVREHEEIILNLE